MKAINFLICIILTSVCSYGQNCDVLVSCIRSDNTVVLLNRASGTGNVVATKIDGNGSTVWNKEYTITGVTASPMNIYDATGDFYFILTSLSQYQFELWKINKSNGNLVWRSAAFNTVTYHHGFEFLDYDANKVVLIEPVDGGGDTAGFIVHYISKTTPAYSDTIIYQISSGIFQYHFAKDSKGNFIYSHNASIRKINGLDFTTTIWDKSYNSGIPSEGLLPTIANIFVDSGDNLYALSNEDYSDLYKINSNNGGTLWKLNNIGYETYLSGYKFKEDYLYISFAHRYVGAVTTFFEVEKINTLNGARLWDNTSSTTNLNMTPVGTVSASSGTNEAIFSFDFGCDGNIYATGYYGSENYAPGAWGIMKINDTNGTKINDITVYNHHDQIMDLYSFGLGAFVINNQPLFVGNLELSNSVAYRTVVKTDLDLNTINSITTSCNNFLAINQPEIKDVVTMHPNPTKGLVYFDLKDNTPIDRVTLYSIEGKELNSWYHTNSIDINDYPVGMYLVKMITKENNVFVKKIIKN